MKKRIVTIVIIGVLILLILGVLIHLIVKDRKKDDTNANMEFVINDTLENGNGSEVKVIVLIGQSNASGVAKNSELEKNVSADKYSEYSNGYSNIYINYYNENGFNKSEGFINVKLGQGTNNEYFGPEIGMGEKLNELYKDEKIFIIKYAWGGSNLHTQWNNKTGNLYKAFIKYTKQSMDYLISKNYNASIVSFMWMQGESDASYPHYKDYEKNLTNMIISIRKDLRQYTKEYNVYFIDAYISDSSYWINYKEINDAKAKVCSKNDANRCIDTISEGLTYNKEPNINPDLAHYDSLSEIKLGHLFVNEYYNADKEKNKTPV